MTVNHSVAGSSPAPGELLLIVYLLLFVCMPITSAQKKSVRKTAKRSVVNRKFKDDLNIAAALFRKKIEKGEKLEQQDLNGMYKVIDKAKKKKIFHRKTAARMKSKFARQFNAIATTATKKTSTKTTSK